MSHSLLQRQSFAIAKSIRNGLRTLSVTAHRMGEMPDPFELATGLEKRELKAIKSGNKDPWMMTKPLKRGPGTKDEPTLIPSAFDGRIVGCHCKDNRFVNWMWLEKGDPKRCECGHYFQLKEMKPL